MYANLQGRFLSRDPMPANGVVILYEHSYGYGRNNPVNSIDPSGMQPQPKKPYKPCIIEFGEVTRLDPKNKDPIDSTICAAAGPGFIQETKPDAGGTQIISECKQDNGRGAFYLHYSIKRKGKPPEQFATCVFDLAFNKILGLCDANGNFLFVVNYNVGLISPIANSPQENQKNLNDLQNEYNKFVAACANTPIPENATIVEAGNLIKKCIDDYIGANLKGKLRRNCNESGDPVKGGGGKFPCIRTQVGLN